MLVYRAAITIVTAERVEIIDITKAVRDGLVPESAGDRHDDARSSDCERGNGGAHLRAALFGRSVALGVSEGERVLGRFQSIDIAVQLLGE